MKLKYYRKKIAIIVVLFTFIPVLLFAGVFYRQIYNERISYHLSINEKYMNSKVDILQEEVIQKSSIIEKFADDLSELRGEKEENIAMAFSDFLQKNPEFISLKIMNEENLAELVESISVNRTIEAGKQIQYYLSEKFELFITYPLMGQESALEYIVAEFSISNVVNWFTEYEPDTYILIISGEETVYKSPEIMDVENETIKTIGSNISILEISDGRKYYGVKNKSSTDGMSIYVLNNDNTIDLYRSLYMNYILKIIFMVLLSAAVTFIISLKLNYPFNKIKSAARAIINGDYDAKVDNVDDELLSLNLVFNEMAVLHQEKNEEFVQYAMTMLEKNEHLTDLNQQLESSYDQLKTITEMLEYSKDKYQALFDHIKEFIWVFDQDGCFTYINSVMCDKLGYQKEELIGCHFFDVFIRFDEEELVPKDELIDQLLRRDYNNLSLWFKSNKDEEILVSANSKRVFKNGVLQGAQGTARTVEFEEMLQNRVLRKNREFEIVKEITWSLANNRTLDALLDKVVQKVEELFMPELCTIRIVELDQLVFKTGVGKFVEYARTDRFSLNEDFSGIAIKENRILRVKDFDNTIFYNRSALEKLFEHIEEIIVIPLENKGIIHGTINIGLSEPLKDVDIKILKALANQASIGIDKVKLYDQLKEDYLNTIRVLASAVEAKDKYTEGHSARVSLIAKRIGIQLGLDCSVVEELEIAGMLHDIGKIGIDDEILTKKGGLTEEEYQIMKTHPVVGKKILDPIGLSENSIDGVFLHHKRYDLTGYPVAVEIESLSLYPSVIGVADAFDAMTSNRTYSQEKTMQVAMDELEKYKGHQFSPEVVEALKNIVENDIESILEIITY